LLKTCSKYLAVADSVGCKDPLWSDDWGEEEKEMF
jgi:hypothetical protein